MSNIKVFLGFNQNYCPTTDLYADRTLTLYEAYCADSYKELLSCINNYLILDIYKKSCLEYTICNVLDLLRPDDLFKLDLNNLEKGINVWTNSQTVVNYLLATVGMGNLVFFTAEGKEILNKELIYRCSIDRGLDVFNLVLA